MMKHPLRSTFLALFAFASLAFAEDGPTATDIEFKAKVDGTTQRYILILPKDFDPKPKHDLMIALHGHGSDRHQFAESPIPEARVSREEAANRGMIFVSPDYRARTSWMGPKAEADVLQIIHDLKGKYKIGNVFLVGASMGGTSVLTFAALHPKEVQGVVSMNGTANHLEYENFQDAISESFGGPKNKIPVEYKKRSAEYWPEKFIMPIAFTVGAHDTVVPPDSVIRLAKIVAKLQPNSLLVFDENGGHSTVESDVKKAVQFVLDRVATLSIQNEGKK